MIYTEEQLKKKVIEMMEVFENEVVEFKEASNNYSFNDIGNIFLLLAMKLILEVKMKPGLFSA